MIVVCVRNVAMCGNCMDMVMIMAERACAFGMGDVRSERRLSL